MEAKRLGWHPGRPAALAAAMRGRTAPHAQARRCAGAAWGVCVHCPGVAGLGESLAEGKAKDASPAAGCRLEPGMARQRQSGMRPILVLPVFLAVVAGCAGCGAAQSAAPVSIRVVLPSPTMAAGSQMAGRVVVDNDTGRVIHAHGCGALFAVALASSTYHPVITMGACSQAFTIPAGKSSYPVRVLASYLGSRTTAGACPAFGGLPVWRRLTWLPGVLLRISAPAERQPGPDLGRLPGGYHVGPRGAMVQRRHDPQPQHEIACIRQRGRSCRARGVPAAVAVA